MSNLDELTVREENRNETSQIAVRVLFFGAARDAVGQGEIMFSLGNPTNAASAFDQVLDAYPALRRFGRSLLFAVNEEYARPERRVFEGDELAVFPPVSGGAGGERGRGNRGAERPREPTRGRIMPRTPRPTTFLKLAPARSISERSRAELSCPSAGPP